MKRLLAIFLCTLLAAATTVIPQSIEQLTQQSVLVISGKAVRSWTTWNPQHTEIVTYTEFTVAQTLKGTQLKSVLVRQIGGSLDGMTLHVAGVGLLQPGEQAVLFLRPGEPDGSGALSITGLMQGYFHSAKAASGPGTRFSNGMPATAHRENLESYDTAAKIIAHSSESSFSLEELQSRVKRASRTGAGQ